MTVSPADNSYPSSPLVFEALFRAYYPRLCYFAHKIIGDRELAQDIVHDVFVKFWEKQAGIEGENAAGPLLYTSVRNACFNLLRHQRVQQKFINSRQQQPADDEMALDHIIRSEVYNEIYQSIETLPEGCRQVLKLSYFEGLKNEAVAQKLGISINTVKTQKARALQLLRLKLDAGTYLLLLVLLRH